MKTLFKGGRVVSGVGTRKLDVLVEGETVAARWATFEEIREMIKTREICRIIGRQFLHQEPQLRDRQEPGYR